MRTPLLSVLICSIIERADMLAKLKRSLTEQRLAADERDDFEVIAYVDDKKISVGTKRNRLVLNSRGEYVCFVDDDDYVSRDYVPGILTAIRSSKAQGGWRPDCIGITGQVLRHGKKWVTFRHSIQYSKYNYDKTTGLITRPPNHLNPIRRDIVARGMPDEMPFPKKDLGEDSSFSRKLRDDRVLTTEVLVDGPVYFYIPGGSWRGKPKGTE